MQKNKVLMLDYISSIIYGFAASLFVGMCVIITKLGSNAYRINVSDKFDDLQRQINKIAKHENKQRGSVKEELKKYIDNGLVKIENNISKRINEHNKRNFELQFKNLGQMLEEETKLLKELHKKLDNENKS